MPGEIQINAITQTPAYLFSRPCCFITPEFQRPYVWGASQIDQFWNDIAKLAADTEAKHFTGVILLQDSDSVGHLECQKVIDGQQRLTTLQLILAALRTVYENRANQTEANSIYNLYLTNRDGVPADQADLSYKIRHSNQDDARTFRHFASRNPVTLSIPADPAQDSYLPDDVHQSEPNSPAIANAYRRLLSKVTEYAHHHSIDELQKAVLHRVTLAIITAKADEPTVYDMFNRLNSAGTALSLPDMVKAETFQQIAALPNADERAIAADLWDYTDAYWQEYYRTGNHFRSNLGYLLHHWLCADSGKFIRDRNNNRGNEETISAYQQAITKHGDIIKSLHNLKKYANAYRQIQGQNLPEHPHFVRDFHASGKHTAYTLALYCPAELHPAAHAQALADLGSYLMRLTLAGTPAGSLNNTVARIAGQTAGRLRKVGAQIPPARQADIIREQLLNLPERLRWPDDAAVISRLSKAPLRLHEARAVITAIAEYRQGPNSDAVVNQDATVEHIMPRSWQRHWPLPEHPDAEQEREAAIGMLGNLTLLHGARNTQASNGGWPQKRDALSQSNLVINERLAQLEHWDEAAIMQRSLELAEIACKVWPKPQPADQRLL